MVRRTTWGFDAMPATLKDVARKANVSYQTVWRAIHDLPGILPSTREHVLGVANRLSYRPNRLAGSLRTKRSHTIGLVVFDVSNSYTAQLISGIESEASKRGYSVVLMSSGDDIDRERNAIRSLLERGVDGLILSAAAHGDHRYLRSELPPDFPFVAVNHAVEGISSVTVAVQNREAGKTAALHLLTQGHVAVAGLFRDLANPSSRERYEGFGQELRKAGVAVRRRWMQAGANTIEFASQAVRNIFRTSQRPTALFASTHQLTEGALLGLHDIGLRHGRDVAVVGAPAAGVRHGAAHDQRADRSGRWQADCSGAAASFAVPDLNPPPRCLLETRSGRKPQFSPA
jgi:LacI family transcriptional regulator